MGFGVQLRSARDAAGLSQQELANKAGIAVDSIQNWEQERTRPRLQALGKLASALGVSLDVLVMSEEDDKAEVQRRRGRPRKADFAPPEPAPAKKTRRKKGE
jgi:transcriptional regulator with XRE-family HTH domain